MAKTNRLVTVGSVCSGIEAASVAWSPLGLEFKWFSEIAPFPSKLLEERYPDIPNLGDMNGIPELLMTEKVDAPDIICGGTPCQAFSYAGWQKGLSDERANLALKFVEVANVNDKVRKRNGKEPAIIFWENVEGVLSDKTNAFGHFISSLAGLNSVAAAKGAWPAAGLLRGTVRTVAWRVLDAKYFGVPQQRRRLYVIAGNAKIHPEHILFETHSNSNDVDYESPFIKLQFAKEGHKFEVFRSYTDCLYSSYATKWNGNAAANNGSLFVLQDGKLRRLSPLECERLMGFPDKYTEISKAKKSNRYQALGNSWVVPVIEWIGKRIISKEPCEISCFPMQTQNDFEYCDFSKGIINVGDGKFLNCSEKPERQILGSMKEIVSACEVPDIYISPVGCAGILRRREERSLSMNPRLEEVLSETSRSMCQSEIEKKSRIQKRGKYSDKGMVK